MSERDGICRAVRIQGRQCSFWEIDKPIGYGCREPVGWIATGGMAPLICCDRHVGAMAGLGGPGYEGPKVLAGFRIEIAELTFGRARLIETVGLFVHQGW